LANELILGHDKVFVDVLIFVDSFGPHVFILFVISCVGRVILALSLGLRTFMTAYQISLNFTTCAALADALSLDRKFMIVWSSAS
jgi:hypothetical protein